MSNLFLEEELAHERHQALLKDATTQRLLHHARHPRSALGSLCISAGTLLIQVGISLVSENR